MRELKFRAWFNRFNKMVYEVDKDFLNLWKGYWDNQIHIVYPDDGDVIEQYTGLKDKNGKEIYEGDIVGEEFEYGGEKTKTIWQVRWCDNECAFELHYVSGFEVDDCSLVADDEENCEVIGNIHENPELLGDEE